MRSLWKRWVHWRAERLRNRLKVAIMFEDAHDFFAGKKTREQSMDFRLSAYATLDGMSDKELLSLF